MAQPSYRRYWLLLMATASSITSFLFLGPGPHHEIRCHNAGLPVRSPLPSCEHEMLFQSWSELDAHVKYTHIQALHRRNAQYRPEFPCRVSGCDARFKRAETFDVYDSHLSTHGIAPGEHLPSECMQDLHSCLYLDCARGPFKLDEQGIYKNHLPTFHGLSSPTKQYIYTLAFIRSDWLSVYYKGLLQSSSQNNDYNAELVTYTASTTAKAGRSRLHMTPRGDTLSPSGQFPCTAADCRAREPFKDNDTLQEHQLKAHSMFLPAACPVYQCDHEGTFESFRDLETHMHVYLEAIEA